MFARLSRRTGEFIKISGHINYFNPDPSEPVFCTQTNHCEGCPYPAHGFICWHSDGSCMEEYGRSVLLEAGDRNIDILDDIDGFMDYEAYGKYRAEMDGVVQTEFGLVRCKSEPFQVEQQGMRRYAIPPAVCKSGWWRTECPRKSWLNSWKRRLSPYEYASSVCLRRYDCRRFYFARHFSDEADRRYLQASHRQAPQHPR